jgi:uncharacterized protein (TIGR03083 family)
MSHRSRTSTGLTPVRPVYLVERFPPLHAELMSLLRGLSPEDWSRPTVAPLWNVKDIAAHLLDTGLRRLSFGRDSYAAPPDQPIASYADLVAYLNRLNAEWTQAARRLSPRLLIEWLDATADELYRHFASLDPHASAVFGVAWAGEETSPVWFDIAREYTERWLHQQQIREAVGARGLVSREWLYPALDVFIRALPHTYRDVAAADGERVRIVIEGDAGGVWTLVRQEGSWRLFSGGDTNAAASVSMDGETAWKLFSKGLTQPAARKRIALAGDPRLGEPVLSALAIMG